MNSSILPSGWLRPALDIAYESCHGAEDFQAPRVVMRRARVGAGLMFELADQAGGTAGGFRSIHYPQYRGPGK